MGTSYSLQSLLSFSPLGRICGTLRLTVRPFSRCPVPDTRQRSSVRGVRIPVFLDSRRFSVTRTSPGSQSSLPSGTSYVRGIEDCEVPCLSPRVRRLVSDCGEAVDRLRWSLCSVRVVPKRGSSCTDTFELSTRRWVVCPSFLLTSSTVPLRLTPKPSNSHKRKYHIKDYTRVSSGKRKKKQIEIGI